MAGLAKTTMVAKIKKNGRHNTMPFLGTLATALAVAQPGARLVLRAGEYIEGAHE